MGQVVQDTQQLIEREHMPVHFLYWYLQQQCDVWHVSVETDTTFMKHNVLHGMRGGHSVFVV